MSDARIAWISGAFGGRKKETLWYLPSGVSASDLIGRYEAIGAADYATSLVNLANPGTNDLVAAPSAPTWTAENGWVGNDSRYFTTGIVPNANTTVFAYYAGISKIGSNSLFGAIDGAKGFFSYITSLIGWMYAKNLDSGDLTTLPPIDNGVICIAGTDVYFNGVLVGSTVGNYTGTGALSFMAIGAGVSQLGGNLKAGMVYNKKLNAAQVLTVTNGMLGISGGILVTSPRMFQKFQRVGISGDIAVSGTLYGYATPQTIEASWAGGAYTDLQTGVTGAFSGTITAAQGQGTLILRVKGTTVSTSIYYVGVGDIFIVAGQSNASGRATNTNQTYSHASLKAGIFGNDYAWKNLYGTSDSQINQVDTVSSDANQVLGSPWVPMASLYMADMSLPCAFVPCAKGGSAITDWLPGADHQDRTTLYGSMIYRALQTGAKCVLWWQGEQEVVSGMSQADYNGHLDTIADALYADLGIKLMACKLETGTGYDSSIINAAIAEAWGDNANVLTGPDFSDLTATGDVNSVFHFKSDAEMTTVSGRWWASIKAAFGW